MRRSLVVALVSVLAACGSSEQKNASPVAPQSPKMVAEFSGEFDPVSKTLKFDSVSALGTKEQALEEVRIVQDGTSGSGPVNSVELVTEYIEDGVSCSGTSLDAVVTVRSFYTVPLDNIYVELTSVTPGREICNSADEVPETSAQYGLISYGNLSSGAGSDNRWEFNLPDTTPFRFRGRVLADIGCETPAAIPGVTLNCSGNAFNDFCFVECDTANGYTGTPVVDSITCGVGSAWSPALSAEGCTQSQSCSAPPTAPAGYDMLCDADACVITCDTGAGYTGTPTVELTECVGGNWTPAFAFEGCSQPGLRPLNAGFEDWNTELTQPLDWVIDPGVGVELETTLVHSGSRSVRLTRNSTTNSNTDVASSPTPVQPSTSYTITIWYYDNNNSARANIVYTWLDSSQAPIGSTFYGSTYTTDQAAWQSLTTETPVSPANAAYVVVGTRVYGQSGGTATGGYFHMDDVSISP